MQEGLIIRSTGSWYDILLENGETLSCRMIGKFRLEGKKLTNPVAVGDKVLLEIEASNDKEDKKTGIIKEILDRKNYVIRQSPRKKHFLHILAANIDQALLVVTVKEPKLKQGFIDRFLLMTEPYDIPVHIVFNKGDIYADEDLIIFQHLKDVYEKIGYYCYITSALENKGIKQITTAIAGKTTLIAGQSGVGKSSLLNRLHPDLDVKTKDISQYTGKGQHTTTFAEMFDLGEDTKIIDSPGIKTLGFNHLEVQDVAHNFKEFFVASSGCKFQDCTHQNEPKCAVKEGIESGEISELRYGNYLQIIEEIEDQNYWERHTEY